MRRVNIIIPVRNGIKYLPLTIESILKTSHPNYRIIIIESESNDGVQYYCDYLNCRYPEKIQVIHTKKEGITKAINKGIKLSDENSDIFLTQNDVIFPSLLGRDWLEEMSMIVQDNPKIGMVTCMNGGGISDKTYLEGFRWTGTWCMYIPRPTINNVGVLDEEFSPGPGDDVSYSYRIYLAGLYVGIANFAVDHHRLGENFNDCSELCQKGAETFRRKYGFQDKG